MHSKHWQLVKITEIMENALLVIQHLQKLKALSFVICEGSGGLRIHIHGMVPKLQTKTWTYCFVLVISRTPKSTQWIFRTPKNTILVNEKQCVWHHTRKKQHACFLLLFQLIAKVMNKTILRHLKFYIISIQIAGFVSHPFILYPLYHFVMIPFNYTFFSNFPSYYMLLLPV